MAQDPYKYFRPEARDLVDQFAKGVLELEKGAGGTATVQRLLRLAHTLKGAARVVKQTDIANRAHAIEDALAPFRDAGQGIEREQIDTILQHIDDISNRLVTLAPADDANSTAPKNASTEEPVRTIRADLAEADAVLDGVAETHALLNSLRGTALGTEQSRHLAELLLAQLSPTATSDSSRHGAAAAGRRLALAEELCKKFAGVERRLGSAIDQMDRELRQLREAAERLRLVAAGGLFVSLERTARDGARALGKEVTFEGRGGDIRLDAQVLEAVQGALIQMVRNAVAHGIELPVERKAAGKPAAGRVFVDVTRRGRKIVFTCRDDGRGIDLDAVRRVAVQRGLLEAKTAEPGLQDVIRLLLGGGISTSQAVTAVAGRGVGLDVVREGVERLGGEVAVKTERGRGTVFELVIPPSLASIEVLVVACEGPEGATSFASIPIDAVRSTLRVAARDIARGLPGATVLFDQKSVPFLPLATALDHTPWSASRGWAAVVVAGADGLAAIGVDRLLGTARIVARPLPERLTASAIVVGASLDAEGNPRLVLDPDGLVAAAQRGSAERPAETARSQPVLVIDDSLTTRMLEQSILESAGYDVDVATSAEEGLEILRHRRYGVILVDVEMPGMDGFTFIERIRADAALRDTPAILITSRASPEDRKRGREAGAHGHIMKSEFDQAELLAMIGPLLG